MKLAVFGGTGQTGSLIVEQAIAAGHQVSMLARDPSKIAARHRLRVVRGDAASAGAINDVVQGADAVLSAMGGGNGTLTTLGGHLVPAMTAAGPRRVVSLVGASLVEPGDPSTLSLRLLRTITHWLAADLLVDGERHARQLEASDLDYTLVRPPRLTNAPGSGRVEHARALPLGPLSSIPRADLASFMLRAAVDGLYLRQAPMVASAR